MRGTISSTAAGGRHALPKRRSVAASALLPALTSPAAASDSQARAGRRRAEGGNRRSARKSSTGGSHRASKHAAVAEASRRAAEDTAERPVPWARTVAFSGVTGVAALTVGLTGIAEPDSASGLPPEASPQQTHAVTVIEAAPGKRRMPVAQRSAPADYAATPVARVPAAPAAPAAPEATTAPPVPAPAAPATPTSRPTPAAPATPSSPAAPSAPDTQSPAPAPESSPSAGLLDDITGPLGDTVTGVVGLLPDLDG